jgi:hypothetical protein
MLSPSEKGQLKNRTNLKPKTRANLDYRIAQKLKKKLFELDEINRALCSIPERNAKRILDDKMVVNIFRLTENMIDILGYVPIEEVPYGQRFISRSKEVTSKNGLTKKYLVELEPTTAVDEARYLLLKEHIERLQRHLDPAAIRTPLKNEINPLPLGFNEKGAVMEGYNLCRRWEDKQ